VSLHVAEEEERQGCSCWGFVGLFVVLGFVLTHFVCMFSFVFFFFFWWEMGVWLCSCVGNVRKDLVLYIL
jgi:hypothetical protein